MINQAHVNPFILVVFGSLSVLLLPHLSLAQNFSNPSNDDSTVCLACQQSDKTLAVNASALHDAKSTEVPVAMTTVTVTFKNQAGINPVFKVSGPIQETVIGYPAPWRLTKTYRIPKGEQLFITAEEGNGVDMAGQVEIHHFGTITVRGKARNGRIEGSKY